MNKVTLKALRGSIKKWEAIVDGMGVDDGADNCPLCALFIDDDCQDCPVYAATGDVHCGDSPYESWNDAHWRGGRFMPHRRIHDDDTAIAAVLELEFLRSLLPSKAK